MENNASYTVVIRRISPDPIAGMRAQGRRRRSHKPRYVACESSQALRVASVEEFIVLTAKYYRIRNVRK
jgi:hypothetical protein